MERIINIYLNIKINNLSDMNKCKIVLDFYNCRPHAISNHRYPYYLVVYKYYYTDISTVSVNDDVIILTTEEFINKY